MGTLFTVQGTITSASAGAVGNEVGIHSPDANSVSIDIRDTYSGTLQFEGTINSIDYFSIPVVPANASDTSGTVTSTTSTGQWIANVAGLRTFRVRASALASGFPRIELRAVTASSPFLFNNGAAGTGGMQVQGNSADNVADTGNPVKVGSYSLNNTPKTYLDGQRANLVSDLYGRVFVNTNPMQSKMWAYAGATGGIVNTVTAVTIKSSAGAGFRNFVTGLTIATDTLGTATELAIRDGAAGTVLWRTKLGTTALPPTNITFPTPLVGSGATLLEIVTLTASTGGVFVNANGYIGSA